MTTTPVSIVVPVYNGGALLEKCLAAILEDLGDRPAEILIVEDGSADDSAEIARRAAADPRVRIVQGRRAGAAAAINDGIRLARHPIVCQIDQDVIVHRGWFARVLAEFSDERIAAVQGRYTGSVGREWLARTAALDLADRYDRLAKRTNHVCTGNVAYRADALHVVGLFDERLGYGYDNDLSYRLARTGYSLVFCNEATATHGWRESIAGYWRQQYGVGYGRLDVIARHPRRWTGDDVSGVTMIAHAGLSTCAAILAAVAALAAATGASANPWAAAALLLVMLLTAERAVAAVRTWRRYRDPVSWLLPVAHAIRDAAWVCAFAAWCVRRIGGIPGTPAHTMPRTVTPSITGSSLESDGLRRAIAVVPAYNERAALPVTIGELRNRCPGLRVLVVDDGSSDGTFEAALGLGCDALRLPIRLGIGGAMRAGIRYARELGFVVVVRLDADGQHEPGEVPRLLAPVLRGEADAVVGVRRSPAKYPTPRAIARAALGALLSLSARGRVSDPTSGFWAFGERATEILSAHHPTGYPEPELRLLLRGRGFRVREVPVAARHRVAGITSLTPPRAGLALARALLALVVVPLRNPEDQVP